MFRLYQCLAVVVVCITVAGCGTIHFTSAKPAQASLPKLSDELRSLAREEMVQHAQSFPVRLPTALNTRPLPYQYGRFTVTVNEDGSQRVEGGEFTPEGKPAVMSDAKHLIVIDYTMKELSYYRREGQAYVPVIGYAVVTPAANFLPKTAVRGRVTAIDTRPTWCPPPSVRRDDPSLPPGCLPFGHPKNAMGKAKFLISWHEVPKWSNLVHLHGASGYPRGKFWDEETFGCIRLEDRAIEALIALLGPNALREGIEVVAHRGSLGASLAQ